MKQKMNSFLYCLGRDYRKILAALKSSSRPHGSRPGLFKKEVRWEHMTETQYQRAIVKAQSVELAGLGNARWCDIELPVVFGSKSRRRCLDLLGICRQKMVLVELKYDRKKHDVSRKTTPKPETNSPLYAMCELLVYFLHIMENAEELEHFKIRHKNSWGEWNWKTCKDPKGVLLVVAANQKYWDRWKAWKGWGAMRFIIEKAQEFLGVEVCFYCSDEYHETSTPEVWKKVSIA